MVVFYVKINKNTYPKGEHCKHPKWRPCRYVGEILRNLYSEIFWGLLFLWCRKAWSSRWWL